MKKNFTIGIVCVFALILAEVSVGQGQNLRFQQKKTVKNSFNLGLPTNLPQNFMQRLHPLNASINAQRNKTSRDKNGRSVLPDTAIVFSNWVNPKRYTYVYDTSGNKTASYVENTTNGNWVYTTMDTISYDSVGNALTHTWKNFTDGAWVNASRNVSSYGVNRTLLSSLNQTWLNSQWKNTDSSTYNYDLNSNLVSSQQWIWDDNNSTWKNSVFTLNVYDSLNHLTSSYRQIWKDTTWVNDQYYTYKYDSAENLIMATLAKGEQSAWFDFYRETYSYNLNRKLTSYLSQLWIDSTWINYDKYIYTYGTSGFVSEADGQKWYDSLWLNIEKAYYTHEPFGGIESSLIKIWKDSVWADTLLTQYAYDETGSALYGDYYTYEGRNLTKNKDGVLQISYNYNIDRLYFTGYHVDVHYKPISLLGVSNFSDNLNYFACNPNPTHASTHLIIDLKDNVNLELDLYDINGRKLKTLFRGMMYKGEHKLPVELQSFPEGIYFVSLIDGKTNRSLKIIRTK